MKLYHFTATKYEFAAYAKNQSEATAKFQRFCPVPIGISDQSTNNNLKAILTDKTKVYRRWLDDAGEAEWAEAE